MAGYDGRLIAQDDTEKGVVHLQTTVVLNESKLPKLVHEEVHAGARRADHLGQQLLPSDMGRPGDQGDRELRLLIVEAANLFKHLSSRLEHLLKVMTQTPCQGPGC